MSKTPSPLEYCARFAKRWKMTHKKRDIGQEILRGLREIQRGEAGRVINVPDDAHHGPAAEHAEHVHDAGHEWEAGVKLMVHELQCDVLLILVGKIADRAEESQKKEQAQKAHERTP